MAYLIQKGTEVLLVAKSMEHPVIEADYAKKSLVFLEENNIIEPSLERGIPEYVNSELYSQFARDGYFGFEFNQKGFDLLFVHESELLVIPEAE